MIFLNGVLVAQSYLGNFNPQTSYDLYISRRPADHPSNAFFSGIIDELAIYNRALTADEINAICSEENGGQPLPPPPIRPADLPRPGFPKSYSEPSGLFR